MDDSQLFSGLVVIQRVFGFGGDLQDSSKVKGSLQETLTERSSQNQTLQNEHQDFSTCQCSGETVPPVAALRQQGLDVRAFAQTFRTIARGLDYQDLALKNIFNLCLDDPLPQWEMEQLRVLDFWNFSNYLHHCKDWQILTPPEPV
ncbi:unnamed protein product [Leuciscus chuanchicus]